VKVVIPSEIGLVATPSTEKPDRVAPRDDGIALIEAPPLLVALRAEA
jgi:hypothetical protein